MKGYTLKAARVNAGLSQQNLADKLHVSRRSVSMWENGKTKVSKRTLMAICLVTGLKEKDIVLPEKLTNVRCIDEELPD